jgi:hypothetical protein
MSPELAEKRQIEAYREMSGEQRLAIGLQLHELACEIARESIRSRYPGASKELIEEKLRDRIRLHFGIERSRNTAQ